MSDLKYIGYTKVNGIIALKLYIVIAGISVEQILIITEGNANHIHYIEGNAAADCDIEPSVFIVFGIQVGGITPFVESLFLAQTNAEGGAQVRRYGKGFGDKIELVAEIYRYAYPALFPLIVSIIFIGEGCIREMQTGGKSNART